MAPTPYAAIVRAAATALEAAVDAAATEAADARPLIEAYVAFARGSPARWRHLANAGARGGEIEAVVERHRRRLVVQMARGTVDDERGLMIVDGWLGFAERVLGSPLARDAPARAVVDLLEDALRRLQHMPSR